VKVYFCGVHPLLLSTVELGNFSLMKWVNCGSQGKIFSSFCTAMADSTMTSNIIQLCSMFCRL
jgi:hypothetical protein